MNLEDNKNVRLLIEAAVVGIITVVVGYIVIWILSNFNKDAKDIHHLQFQEDANEDGHINHFHKNHRANLMSICKECHDHITKNKIRYRRTKTSDGIKFVEI